MDIINCGVILIGNQGRESLFQYIYIINMYIHRSFMGHSQIIHRYTYSDFRFNMDIDQAHTFSMKTSHIRIGFMYGKPFM